MITAPAPATATPAVGDVVALVLARERQARLRDGLRERAPVRFVSRCREVAHAVAEGAVAATVLELRDADGTPTAPTIRQLRAAFPRTPVLALAPGGSAAAGHELVAAVQAGANGIILEGVEDAGVALLDALDHAEDECVARLVMAELWSLLPDEARPVVEFCLTQARRPLAVDEVAAALGMCRRTLGRRLRRAGLPSPLAVIGWCRLLVAARVMEERGRTLEQVALRLQFPGAASLRNMLARYTALRPREVRENGGLRCVLFAFRRVIEAGRRAARDEPDEPEVV
ncbi:MAG: helix-turn-helix domain-containing protein [Gemmatimonadaceae bacterium]